MIIKKKLFLILYIILAAGISYLVFYSCLKMEYSSIFKKIRKAGYPVTPEELEKWYPEPRTGQNAAYFYLKAADNFVRNPDDVDPLQLLIGGESAKLPSPEIPLSLDIIKNSESYLKANLKSIELLHNAADFKSCRYPVEVGNPDRRLAYLSNLRHGARLLSMEAVLAAEKGDSEKAVKALVSAVALASSLENEPTLDSLTTMMGTEHATLIYLDRILTRCDFSSGQLKLLSAKLAAFDEMKTLERALAGERTYVFAGHALEEYLEYIDYNYMFVRRNPFLKKSVEFISDFLLLWMMNELASADFISALISLCKTTPESALSGTAAILDRIHNLPSRLYAAKLYLPNLLPAICKKAMTITEARVARTGIAVVSYHRENGKMPEDITELAPKYINSIPVDPMDGKPIRYRKTEKGAIVYSVGTDRVDNGGTPGCNNGISKGEDFVFRISASSK